MTTLHHLESYRGQQQKAFFDRNELNLLLSLYATRVASGEWRDYAIDQHPGYAVFSVFRHTNDQPLFSIVKERTRKGWEFRVSSGRERLSTACSLKGVLKIFKCRLRVVT